MTKAQYLKKVKRAIQARANDLSIGEVADLNRMMRELEHLPLGRAFEDRALAILNKIRDKKVNDDGSTG